LDAQHVARYDGIEDAAAEGEVRLLRDLGMDRSSTVVDMGAGTGQFTIAAAPFVRQVIAVDISPVMLSKLSANVARTGHTNVQCALGGFLSYEHSAEPADFVYSRWALHHLPDFWKSIALARMYDMLSPGGVLRLWDVVYSFPIREAEDRIERWCASLPADGDGWTRADLHEHIQDEHSTYSWLLEPMIEQAGFAICDHNYTEDGMFAKYIMTRGKT
jgi:SAM-dependent methyltransferase